MKITKRIPVIMTLCVAAAVVGGCTTGNAKEYDALNEKLNHKYSQIVLTVTDAFDENSVLKSEYTMTFPSGAMKVNYSVERFAELSLDFVADQKTTLVGEATVAGGNIVYGDGDKVDLTALASGTGLNFKEEYFANIDLTGMYLKADVTNPGGFTGTELNCTGMKVNATFLEVFYTIQITYTAQNGNAVEYLYTFTV